MSPAGSAAPMPRPSRRSAIFVGVWADAAQLARASAGFSMLEASMPHRCGWRDQHVQFVDETMIRRRGLDLINTASAALELAAELARQKLGQVEPGRAGLQASGSRRGEPLRELDDAVLPTGSDQHGCSWCAAPGLDVRDSSSRPITGSSLPCRAPRSGRGRIWPAPPNSARPTACRLAALAQALDRSANARMTAARLNKARNGPVRRGWPAGVRR